jgi:hypothetical protein
LMPLAKAARRRMLLCVTVAQSGSPPRATCRQGINILPIYRHRMRQDSTGWQYALIRDFSLGLHFNGNVKPATSKGFVQIFSVLR